MAYKKAPKIKRGKNGKYFMRPQDIVNAAKKLDVILYRIGEHGLFQVIGEYEGYYTGSWQIGGGYKAVLKDTLRKPTDKEIEQWNNRYEIICGVKVPFNVTKD